MSESVFRQAANLRSSTVNAEAIIRRELSPSEALLWAGRPRLGIVFRAYDLLLVPFTLLWLAMVVGGEINVLMESPPGAAVAGTVFLSVFFLVGLFFGFGRFFVDRWLRERTVYGVSSERVLIVSHWFRRKVKSLCLDTLIDLTLTESANGSGTITFGPLAPMSGWYVRPGWTGWGWAYIPLFELAEGARQVYETVRDARRAAIKRMN
jgi:hypothetical protein